MGRNCRQWLCNDIAISRASQAEDLNDKASLFWVFFGYGNGAQMWLADKTPVVVCGVLRLPWGGSGENVLSFVR